MAASVGGVTFDVCQWRAWLFLRGRRSRVRAGARRQASLTRIRCESPGAKGDGTTKDTVALQNVIDSIPTSGGTVYLHDGTFITGTLSHEEQPHALHRSNGHAPRQSDVADFPAQAPRPATSI